MLLYMRPKLKLLILMNFIFWSVTSLWISASVVGWLVRRVGARPVMISQIGRKGYTSFFQSEHLLSFLQFLNNMHILYFYVWTCISVYYVHISVYYIYIYIHVNKIYICINTFIASQLQWFMTGMRTRCYHKNCSRHQLSFQCGATVLILMSSTRYKSIIYP